MSDGTGTDNMTCVIVYFRDPEEVKIDQKNHIQMMLGMKSMKLVDSNTPPMQNHFWIPMKAKMELT